MPILTVPVPFVEASDDPFEPCAERLWRSGEAYGKQGNCHWQAGPRARMLLIGSPRRCDTFRIARGSKHAFHRRLAVDAGRGR